MPGIQYTDGAFGEPRVSHVTHNIENIERYTQGLQLPHWAKYDPGPPSRYVLGVAPPPPTVSAGILAREEMSFIDFISHPHCELYLEALFGPEGGAAVMIRELCQSKEFHFFGVRAGLLDSSKSANKTVLKEFVRRAYRGDPERRGLLYWQRVSSLLWNAYTFIMKLRKQCRKIEQQELKRISKLGEKRAKCTARVRKHRRKKKAAAVIAANESVGALETNSKE